MGSGRFHFLARCAETPQVFSSTWHKGLGCRALRAFREIRVLTGLALRVGCGGGALDFGLSSHGRWALDLGRGDGV